MIPENSEMTGGIRRGRPPRYMKGGIAMMDICFGDSECGMLRFVLGKRDVLRGWSTLDLGRLAAPDFLSARKQWCEDFFVCSKWKRLRFFREEKRRAERILARAKRGDIPRIWVASQPSSRCGFYQMVHALQAVADTILVVELPDDTGYQPGGADRSWCELDFPEVADCLNLQRELTVEERSQIADTWERLTAENAELRVNEDGRIVSVPVDYLDEEIYARSPEGEFPPIRAVGDMIGRSKHMISDSFVSDRLEAMIAAGRYEVVRQAPPGADPLRESVIRKVEAE